MCGLAFSLSMVWAQAFPFVALLFYNEGDTISKDTITLILICSFSSWLLLNIIFFSTINLNYLGTFFGTTTAPQYTCKLFLESEEDSAKFRAAFTNRSSYTEPIHEEVRTWVANNVERWKVEAPSWFKIEMVPDDFLPSEVVVAEGGAARRRRVRVVRCFMVVVFCPRRSRSDTNIYPFEMFLRGRIFHFYL